MCSINSHPFFTPFTPLTERPTCQIKSWDLSTLGWVRCNKSSRHWTRVTYLVLVSLNHDPQTWVSHFRLGSTTVYKNLPPPPSSRFLVSAGYVPELHTDAWSGGSATPSPADNRRPGHLADSGEEDGVLRKRPPLGPVSPLRAGCEVSVLGPSRLCEGLLY